MTDVHLILQGQPNVGKSFIATVLAQYKYFKGQTPVCLDTNPLKATFAGFQAFDVDLLQILDEDQVSTQSMERLMKKIESASADVIIDTSASCFVPLYDSLLSHDVIPALQALGHRLLLHLVIMGGEALFDTVRDFAQVIESWPEGSPVIVWLNPYEGTIQFQGKDFEQMKAYADHKHRLAGLIYIPPLSSVFFELDLQKLWQDRLTFDEGIRDPQRWLFTRQRLKMIRDRLYAQLDLALGDL